MAYAIVVAWLLARHPELTDAEVEVVAQRMTAEVNRWTLGFPVVMHLAQLYDAVRSGGTYTPPGAVPTFDPRRDF